MANETVLAVEDEADIRELIRCNLEKNSFTVKLAASAEDAWRMARHAAPDLILLDLMLPGMDGLEFCRMLKNNPAMHAIPIVMLTAKGEEADIVAGLELGAADYITKPFSPRVLLARLRAILRREQAPAGALPARIQAGDIALDLERHEVTVKKKEVALTLTEFQILAALARKPGRVFTRQQIVDAVRGEDYAVTERSVDVQMVGLRKKLGAASEVIETVRGVGYRFRE